MRLKLHEKLERGSKWGFFKGVMVNFYRKWVSDKLQLPLCHQLDQQDVEEDRQGTDDGRRLFKSSCSVQVLRCDGSAGGEWRRLSDQIRDHRPVAVALKGNSVITSMSLTSNKQQKWIQLFMALPACLSALSTFLFIVWLVNKELLVPDPMLPFLQHILRF